MVSAGGDHACGITVKHVALCWGGDPDDLHNFPKGSFTQLSSGDDHTCAVRVSTAIVCWGDDSQKQAEPKTKTIMFTQVTSGLNHACGLETSGTIFCWGKNNVHQATPPSGAFVQVSAGGDHTCAIDTSGNGQCWGNHRYGQSTVPTGHTWSQISAGWGYACGITQSTGIIGPPSAPQSHRDVSRHSVPSNLICWGKNRHRQATPPAGQFWQVSTGRDHACAIRFDGTLACWGYNNFKQCDRSQRNLRRGQRRHLLHLRHYHRRSAGLLGPRQRAPGLARARVSTMS